MGLFEGKKGLIVGVANDRSIAWAIARTIMEEGGECGFTYLPDREDDEKQKNRRRVEKCTRDYPEQTKFLVPMNVADDENIKQAIDKTVEEFGKIDFLLHSVAFADRDDLSRDTIETSREGFKMAMEISAYSLIAIANAAKGIFNENGSIAAMTYYGGEKCVPGYNVMGICKAALEASVRYLSHDLGPQGIRVNAVSAGPLKTLAGSAAGVGPMLQMYEHMAPLARNITHEEVGRTGAFLLSDFSDGITGEILHIDGGYNIMGHPGRLLDKLETE
ncbi:MAG TPA: enoyl-[acyl-carrier-protein] reductase FabI [Planctomycetaceae bacterium]|jgi:enoyl-[acyl-carrier protein] reductase I|nr:enoyl-[acyl-carrier-protein] reductase FabI [Rhodopirellula sp.]MCH2362442.1 enoyl-ACP reductase [Pirellulales bacterium]HAL12738.1 enoyl-[acyl-carrier-protein] reductase FabI [Planctomycetaceae bacterium]HCK71852.1 enoyl-[acyl-carrier-protein] reductase FabI [Planctomycetaceae bacterium]HCP84920.1 enoyl-[acyl-carrier-protein] reductase FabI [Planctomycetaceae bacterium]|tara:strand:+ start:1209 stop:2033 length:825 start_codon:yes stop_codon:yes gene_type:complete